MVVPTAVGERDEPHARLDEPPREQHPHAGGIATVFILDGVGLLRHVERFLRLGGTDQSVGPLIKGVEGVERVALLLLPKVVVDDVEHPPPLVKPGHVDASRQVEVADLKLGIGRIGAEAETGVGTRQVARARELVGDARDADVGGEILARSEFVGDHGSDARILQRRARPIAREHVVRAALVGRLAVGHRAADREFVGDLGRMREQFTKSYAGQNRVDAAQGAAVFDRRVGLGVERFLVGVAAGQVDVDDRLGDAFLGRLAGIGPGCLHPKEVAEREAQATKGANGQKAATIDTVREACHRSFSPEHPRPDSIVHCTSYFIGF